MDGLPLKQSGTTAHRHACRGAENPSRKVSGGLRDLRERLGHGRGIPSPAYDLRYNASHMRKLLTKADLRAVDVDQALGLQEKACARPGVWRRYISGFYLSNAAALAAYVALRSVAEWESGGKRRGHLKSPEQLWQWEKRTFWMLSALAAGKYLKRATVDAFIAEILGYIKLSTAALLCAVDLRLGVCLLLGYLLTFLLFTQPRYDGPSLVKLLTPAALNGHVLNGAQNRGIWLVMFSAQWSSACTQAEATFAELSVTYGSENVRFAELDVGRWPKIAQQFGVITESIPRQLPAFLLFKKGKLVKRLPPENEAWDSKGRLKERLVKEFDLDILLASSLSQE